jgi:Tfp pilus assembly protein PilF
MPIAKLRRNRLTALFVSLGTAALLISLPAARAQDSGSQSTMSRTDRPEISVSVRDDAGAPITSAGTVKLLHDGSPSDEAGLAHGRAFFSLRAFGDYTVVVDATGYNSAQKDVNASVAMRYEVDVNLRRDSAPDQSPGAPGKPILAPRAKEALDKSLKALSENKLSEAEKYVSQAAKLAPGHPDVLYVQGVLFLNQQKWVQAQSALEKASQMDPTSAQVFSALGMAFADQGKYDEAIPQLEKSLQLGTGNWETHWTLGRAYYHRQQYDQALTTSQLALTESNGKAPQIELLVAQSLTAVGRYEDAAQTLRDFLKRYGDRPEAPTARRWLDGLAKNGKIHPH